MATTYDKASLVMIPSGYKDDKLYSVKPTDGSGDFTFSRDGSGASPATRVNASGLIEKGRTNEILQSNSFDTTWVSANVTETSGQSGYDGSSDAWLLAKFAAVANLQQSISLSGVLTFSAYMKAGSLNWGRLQILDGAGNPNAFFDLQNGVVGTTAGTNYIDSSIESIGSGWYRCSISVSGGSTSIRIYPAQADNDTSGTSGNIYIQDAQLEQGLISTSYIETTTAPVSAGLLGDMPRLDYSGGATCPSLLLEPSRVNVVEYAEYFDIYTKSNATITNNSDQSPEGLQNASSLVGNGATSSHYIFRNSGTAVSGTDYTISFFAKSGSLDYVQLVMGSGAFGVMHQNFDLSNGTIGSSSGSVTPFIESYANNWYRVGVTITATASTTITPFIALANSSTMSRLASFATSDDVKIYGLQVESGSYPTSYIPTYGSASTRGADFGNDNDLVDTAIAFGTNDDFTLFYEGSFNDLSSTSNMLMGGGRQQLGASYKNYWWAQNATSMRIVGEAETLMAYTSMSITDNTNVKLLVKRSGSVIDFFVNGSKLTTTQQTTNTAFTFRSLGWAYNNAVYKVGGDIKKALVFESALTDAECIALTTL